MQAIVFLLLLDGSVAIFTPGTSADARGVFFATRFFQIFIKFYGGTVFLYSIGYPDFLKFELWLRNSVHTMTPRHTPIGLGGGRVGFECGELSTLSRGYGNDLWYTRCIGWGLPSRSYASHVARLFYLGIKS